MPAGTLYIINVVTTKDDGTDNGTATIQYVNTTGETATFKMDNGAYQASADFTGLAGGYHTAFIQATVDGSPLNDNLEFFIESTTIGGGGGGELGDKYILEFDAVQSADVITLTIRKEGYVGATSYMTGTGHPLKLSYELLDSGVPKKLEPVLASRLEINIRQNSFGEFSEFEEIDDREYLGVLEVNSVEIWRGYIITDSYSEDYVGNKPALQLVATDGLSNLQNVEFKNSANEFFVGYNTVSTYITNILNKTGISINIKDSVNIYDTAMDSTEATYSPLVQSYFSCEMHNDYENDTADNCLLVLQKILLSYGARLYQDSGWVIRRIDTANEDYTERIYDMNWALQSASTISPVKNFSTTPGSYINFANHSQIKETIPAISKLEVLQKRSLSLSLMDGEFYTNLVDDDNNYEEWTKVGTVTYLNDAANLSGSGTLIFIGYVRTTNNILKLKIKNTIYTGASSSGDKTFSLQVTSFYGATTKWLDSSGSWQSSNTSMTITKRANQDNIFELEMPLRSDAATNLEGYFLISITNIIVPGTTIIDYVRLNYNDSPPDVTILKESGLKINYQPDIIENLHSDLAVGSLIGAYYGGIYIGTDTLTTSWTDAIYTDTLINIFMDKLMYEYKKPTWLLSGDILADSYISPSDVFLENSKYFVPLRMDMDLKHNISNCELVEFLQYPDVPAGDYLLLDDTEYILINDTEFILISD